MYYFSRKVSLFMFAWGLAGLFFSLFIIYKIHARVMLDTAECLIRKTPDGYGNWFSHLAQLVYRVIFETCSHDYR